MSAHASRISASGPGLVAECWKATGASEVADIAAKGTILPPPAPAAGGTRILTRMLPDEVTHGGGEPVDRGVVRPGAATASTGPEGTRPLAVLRADASATIGFGHVARSTTLGAELQGRGWSCLLATRHPNAGLRERLARLGIGLLELAETVAIEDEPDVIALALSRRSPVSGTLLVTDHYGIDAGWHRRATWATAMAAIDDLAEAPQAVQVLLNQNLGVTAARYDGLVPPDAELLLGPVHALVGPAFATQRAAGLRDRRQLRRVLVLLGGADEPDVTRRAAAAAASLGLDVDVVVGPHYGHVVELQAWAASAPRVAIHVDTPEVARLMAAADVCIGAPGSASWERCTLGLPAVLVTLAQNQVAVGDALAAAGAAIALGWHGDVAQADLAAALEELRARPESLGRMSEAAAGISDGRGAPRVADALEARMRTEGSVPVRWAT